MYLAQTASAQDARRPAPGIDPDALRGSNVNPVTLLASDYLNHFNDAAAALEMLPHMPECLEELERWRPRGYCEHFRNSSLRDAALALAAWRHVPPAAKQMFDDVVNRLDAAARKAIHEALAAAETGDHVMLEERCETGARALQALIRAAGDIVNGSALRRAQARS